MSERCPYLGLKDSRERVLLLPSAHHRCFVRGQPERAATAYQAELCLTPSFHRCPRLSVYAELADVRAGDAALQDRPPEVDPLPPEAEAPTPAPPHLADNVPWSRPALRRPELEPIAQAKEPQPRRRVSGVELAVLSMGVAIILAFFFAGYAVVFRWQAGPGMEVPTPIPRSAQLATAASLPTLVPTFTPVPSVTPSLVTPELPTPTLEPGLPAATVVVRPPAASPPTRLVIPSLDLDIPVLTVGVKTIQEGGRSKVVWADVPNAGGFHQTSAYPGNPGNTVINGHRDILGSVFRHLDQIEPGDEIVLYVGEESYAYYVSEILIVPEAFASTEQRAENLRLIGYWPEERLTLVTCTPVGLATHRLLVIARPSEQPLPQMPEAGSDDAP